MRRKDMLTDGTTLYAINATGVPRPGYVMYTGNPAAAKKDIRCVVYWRWPGSDEDWLDETPNVLDPTSKYDTVHVGTADVLKPWAEYCREGKAYKAAKLQERIDAEAAHEARKQAELARLQAVAHWLPGDDARAYLDIADMRYLIANDRGSDTRYSARHVLDLLERVQAIHRDEVLGLTRQRDSLLREAATS